MKTTKQVTLDENFVRLFRENKNINASSLINELLKGHFEAQNPQKDLKIDQKVTEIDQKMKVLKQNKAVLKQNKTKNEVIESYKLPQKFIDWIIRRKFEPNFLEIRDMKREHGIPATYEGSKIAKLWAFTHKDDKKEEEVKND